jgi:hypothetical protein
MRPSPIAMGMKEVDHSATSVTVAPLGRDWSRKGLLSKGLACWPTRGGGRCQPR